MAALEQTASYYKKYAKSNREKHDYSIALLHNDTQECKRERDPEPRFQESGGSGDP